jgi:hypothetical protein
VKRHISFIVALSMRKGYFRMDRVCKKRSGQPLRTQPDYGERRRAVNPYLNTPPTELSRKLKTEKDPHKRKQMKEALEAWRTVVPGPRFLNMQAAELLKVARLLLC